MMLWNHSNGFVLRASRRHRFPGLGGENHFAADRAVAEQVLANMPTALTVARENRAVPRPVRGELLRRGGTQAVALSTRSPLRND